ncbi:glycerol kinase GlpK [Paenalcaligenes sp. Me131]|uniref:glycerol kinase GlpK n=1 Tax=Paenalcaligenes sp. Me131 TaxID=3392636 RepID=UPI003D2E9027
MTYILALDQGTSSSRSILFDKEGRCVAQAQQEFAQHFPHSGWVEHDPQAIWESQLATATRVLKESGVSASQIAAIGIANQRETTLVWDKHTGEPIYPAIVWQDRRTQPLCQVLLDADKEDEVQARTGLRLDPYFSATKLRWILDNVPHARQQAEKGELAFGTVDSWLIWKLTGGQQHLSDVSNASRTMLFNIHTQRWDEDLLQLFNIPASLLPCVRASSDDFGYADPTLLGAAIPIRGVAGDQQAALFGQAGFEAGMVKNTYGTGCFMLMHTGHHALNSEHGLLCTQAAQPAPGSAQYALEGSVFIGGAVVQWLRDGLKAISASHEVEALAETVSDSDGVILVPAFTGLGAPYWDPEARGSITGLTRNTSMAHIAYAALESIAFQSTALLQAMLHDAQKNAIVLKELRVDGGACSNNMLMQLQADLLGIDVVRPAMIETTALGAAYLAGLGCGLFSSQAELSQHWRIDRRFSPRTSASERAQRFEHWEQAVRRTRTL